MNATVKYFMNMIREIVPEMRHMFVFKNFWTDENGVRIWSPDDRTNHISTKKTMIAGVDAPFPVYFNASTLPWPECRSQSFEYNWKFYGTNRMPFSMVENSLWEKPLESMFMQMLILVNRGFNMFLGNNLIMKKNSSYEHLMNIDLMDAVE